MFLKLSDRPEKEPVPGYKVRFVHGEHMTLAYWRIEAGAVLSPHSHPHEQVSSVMEGQFELTIEGETKILGPGSVGVIAPHARQLGGDGREVWPWTSTSVKAFNSARV